MGFSGLLQRFILKRVVEGSIRVLGFPGLVSLDFESYFCRTLFMV